MTQDDLRARLTAIAAEPHDDTIVYGDDRLALLDHAPRPAAVLVSIVLADRSGILLTKRTSHLRRHSGQVCFPGGSMDDGESPEATALREAEEEVALDPRNVQVLGRMANYLTRTGYRITPVLGLIPPGLTLHPSPQEVESVFILPIDVVLDPTAPQRRRHHEHGRTGEYWVWPHPEHFIWGATAAILVHLAEKLRALG